MKEKRRCSWMTIVVVIFTVVMLASFAYARKEPTAGKAEEKIVINIWWWGEEEKPGIKNWLNETIVSYKKAHPNIDIVPVLQTVDTVQSAFRTAAAAKDPDVGPDIQFFWPGIWLMIDVWNGYVEPVENVFPQSFLDKLNISKEVKYDGKTWAIPWYTLNWPIVYNKKMFKAADLDPENPPTTADELILACEKLKKAGYTPIGVGTKDGYFMNWWLNNFGFQGFDSLYDIMDLFANGDVDDPRVRSIFQPLYTLYTRGYFNKNATSLSIYEGNETFKAREVAMTICVFPDWIREMGDEEVGVMLPPVYGEGYLADKGVAVTSQTFGISSWSVHKKEAADFIMFMMSSERSKPMYEACHAIHARKDFDPSVLETQMERDMYGWIRRFPDNGSAENFFPEKVVYEGFNPAAQLIFSENYTVGQCIEFLKNTVEEWRALSPEEVRNYSAWSNQYR